MPLKMVIYSGLLLLTACSQPDNSVAIKQFSRDEQTRIASERNTLVDSAGDRPLLDTNGHRVTFTMTPAVFDDWERMRRELRGN